VAERLRLLQEEREEVRPRAAHRLQEEQQALLH